MEDQIRLTAFDWLRTQIDFYGEVIPRKKLEYGFEFQGQRITLVGPSGIWKPRQFDIIPLSITTILNGPYVDRISEDGFLSYKYRGTNPDHRDNTGLRMAMKSKTPLIYFVSLSPGQYMANFPAYIIGDNPASLEFSVALDDEKYLRKPEETNHVNEPSEYYRRKYITTLVEQRAHQQSFRLRVLAAYNSQCCLCKLNHSELLDAAHIINDTEPLGDPIVPNGLTLCKIHHTAFDVNIIGISPDYHIHVREDILHEIDGPMLKHGLQELHHHKIILPGSKKDYPDRERLDWRFQRFLKVG
ncbi:MAG: HNH endonuclease [Bacteroidales bacterium]|nr:HNH endonuclease [Bacteroidales bacterium]